MSGWSSSGAGLVPPIFDFKQSVRVATVVALPPFIQVGNVLTEVGVGALPLIDTVALVVGNRVLVKSEGGGTSVANGIYDVTSLGSGATPWVLTRSADADTSAEVTAGMVVPVEEGFVNADTLWMLITNNPIVLNVTALTFAQIAAAANASTIAKGVVEIATQAEAYAGTPYLGGTGAVLVPSITNLLVRRQDPANALFTVATGAVPNARGTEAVDFQSYRYAITEVASGSRSQAFGRGNKASGTGSLAIGTSSEATATHAVAIGRGSDATGYQAIACGGFYNKALASRASAFGSFQNSASGIYASAFGCGDAFGFNTASGAHSSSFGNRNLASALYACAFGYANTASATRSSSFGVDNDATGTDSSAFGRINLSSAASSSAFGRSNTASGISSSAFGLGNSASGLRGSAFGNANTALSTYSSSFGRLNAVGSVGFTATRASGFGYGNVLGSLATSDNSSAFGYKNTVNASNANAFGRSNTIRNAVYGIAVGATNLVGSAAFAANYGASAIGSTNTIANLAPAPGACAFGRSNTVNTGTGMAFGANNLIGVLAYSASSASAFGNLNRIGQYAIADKASAFGFFNKVNSKYADAVGYKNTIANANYGSAFGANNLVGSVGFAATKSSAFGYGNVLASLYTSTNSSAFGYKNTVNAIDASAIGSDNSIGLSSSFGASAFGRSNIISDSQRSLACGFVNVVRNAPYGTAVGASCSVGTAVYGATKSAAFGYLNRVANDADSNNSCAFGSYNRTDNGPFLAAFGNKNFVGSVGYAALNSSSFGYNNRIAQLAACTYSSAFGYTNKVDNCARGSAFGSDNIVGSAGFVAFRGSAFGYKNLIAQTASSDDASAFGSTNTINNAVFGSAIGAKNLVGSAGYTALKASAFGYGNEIGQTLNSNYSNAVGYENVVNLASNNAFGSNNTISNTYCAAFGRTNTTSGPYSSAFGQANSVVGSRACGFGYGNSLSTNAPYASGFGYKNLVGTAAYSANKSSAFGYNNQIGQTANADNSSASGYKNTVNNSMYAMAVGASNLVGSAAFTGLKSSAVGCRNEVGQSATADNSNAFGYFNKVNNAVSGGSAFGCTNLVGSAAYTATKSSAFGYGNQIGQTANSNYSSAFGYLCQVHNEKANAFGFKAINRITQTTVINGPIMTRKDNGEGVSPAAKFETFNGVIVTLESEEIDFTAAAADYEIALPAGVWWFFNEIDVKATDISMLVTQPTIRAGIAGGGQEAKYLAATLTTLLTVTGKRERYQTLLADDAESSTANLSVGVTIPATVGGGGSFKGRFILVGILEEIE